mgnify:FL=1
MYKKNSKKVYDDYLFGNPSSEYRAAPFWSWNCRLDPKELHEQIDILKKMGFGGFHMHVRYGLDTPYLSDDFMKLIKDCTERAKSEKMLAWLYDEDRWPSGFAGGLVTREKEYRARFLLFTVSPYERDAIDRCKETTGFRTDGDAELVARFDVLLDKDGNLEKYRVIDKNDIPDGTVWYAYIDSPKCSDRYNGYTYVNTLDKKSIDRFIEITYETYKKWVGEDFDGCVPAIFTDEPQFPLKGTFRYPTSLSDVTLPWTDDIEETFVKAYGDSLVNHIPELFWELPDGVISLTRYHYHDHISERFANAFPDNCGKWCSENGLLLTGHMMREPSLTSQCGSIGEAMRAYRGFHIPGIDILCNKYELTTAKQAASAAHQFGREGVMSELYGVTGWDFDFRGHKLQGDWQAALGVTVRVPHLAWVSMHGEAKRDYPASISYQSPWYDEYSYIENHFARLNTALTRGKPVVKVGVIHPIESYWLHWGPSAQTALVRSAMDSDFSNITSWLLYGSVDFDYICESLIPELRGIAASSDMLGKMKYDVIIVPGCETLRSTTLDFLENFKSRGGKLIFAGKAPVLENAVPSVRGKILYDDSENVPFNRGSILSALEEYRTVDIRNSNGELTSDYLYQLRDDTDSKWLFVCNGKYTPAPKCDISVKNSITVTVRGLFMVRLYDTLSGEIGEVDVGYKNGCTVITTSLYIHDSRLYRLYPLTESDIQTALPKHDTAPKASVTEVNSLTEINSVTEFYGDNSVLFELDEPNALLLDTAIYSFDDGAFSENEEELLRIDSGIRRELGWMQWSGNAKQPWCITDEPITHRIKVRFTVNSEIAVSSPYIALEDPETAKIYLNGFEINNTSCGWYVDKAIKKVRLPDLIKGKNTIEIEYPFGKRTTLEWCYLLGDFGVCVNGREKTITEMPKLISHDDITRHFLPFYSGKLTYKYTFELAEDCCLSVNTKRYRASAILASIDGGAQTEMSFSPYIAELGECKAGKHTVDITLYIPRTNAFGPVHDTAAKSDYLGPNTWRTSGDKWSYEYNFYEEGLLSAPIFRIKK